MKLTQALLGEHAVFGPLFDHLEDIVPQADCAGKVRALGALLAAPLASHAHLEDELLFRALESVMETRMGPVAVMRMEHEQIEGGLERLPGIDDVDSARRTLLHVVATARDHFAKEEQVLFPLAAQLLGEESLEALGRRWAEARGVVEAEAPACA